MLHVNDVPLSQSALLVIDVQDSFKLHAESWEQRHNLEFEQNVAALVDAYRQANLPIFYILHSDADEGFQLKHPALKLMDFLGEPPETPLLKNTRNAFTSTTLQADLIHAGVRRLTITGIQTEQCCETTTRLAADLGYAVDFVLDATQTFPIHNQTLGTLGGEDIFTRTRFALEGRFARIPTTQQLLDELNKI